MKKRMDPVFVEETKQVYRLKVPFDNIYTSVFLIVSGNEAVLVDCATTRGDVDGYILPALAALGYRLFDIKALVLTHSHGDHAGGLNRIRELAPQIEVVTDLRALLEGVFTYLMAGHTADCIGILDTRTHTLLSGDGLQGAGVDKYRCSVEEPDAYLQTLERIKADERIENVLFSHAYEPWNTDGVFDRKGVCDCLLQCKKYVHKEVNDEGNTGK